MTPLLPEWAIIIKFAVAAVNSYICQFLVFSPALIVRFITKRFIGEYDPTLEKLYTFHTIIGNDLVNFEIYDTAGQTQVR